MLSGFLPIGSVVVLKEGAKRLMIVGVLQRDIQTSRIWEYAGVLYPEGYIGADKIYLFNTENIDRIFALGYQDEEQFNFKKIADEKYMELAAAAYENAKNEENQEDEEENND